MENLLPIIKKAITEDAPFGDITVNTLCPHPLPATATILAKQKGLFFGKHIIETMFKHYDPGADLKFFVNDSDPITNHTTICTIQSTHPTILLLERTLLNYIQRLSAITTTTNQYVKKLNNPVIKICDTRKTTPGLRMLEKQAVKAGGGTNHRFGLSDMILIKENHLKILEHQNRLDTLDHTIKQAKLSSKNLKAMIEIETYSQLLSLNLSSFNFIMLDNFKWEDIRKATSFIRTEYPEANIEVSGNISLDTIAQYQCCDIDRISVGALTHSVQALDISLLMA